jgi:hypothetical protein
MTFTASLEPGSEFFNIESVWHIFLQYLLGMLVLGATKLNAVARSLGSFASSYREELEFVVSVYTAYKVPLPNICKVEAFFNSKAPEKESTQWTIPLI